MALNASRPFGIDTQTPAASNEPDRTLIGTSRPEVRLNGARLQLKNHDIFSGDGILARRLIDHAFALNEVRSVLVRRERGLIDIELTPSTDHAQAWRRLGASLRDGAKTAVLEPASRAARLDLSGPAPGLPVRVTRAGNILTTFKVRVLPQQHLRIGHPLLRRREVRLRFEELLRSIHGVTEVRTAGLWASALVAYDPALIEPAHLLRLLEGSWPELVNGQPSASRPRELLVAGGLLAFSFVAQFLRPSLLPWATAAMALYSLPNLAAAIRDLTRFRVGLPALYSAGLGFLLWTGLPLASSVLTVLLQFWPAAAKALASNSERRLFAEYRRRLASARVSDGRNGEITVGLDDLGPDAEVVVRSGDFVPVDGAVVDGLAAVDEEILTGVRGPIDKIVGDLVSSGSYVRDGFLKLRVRRVGAATAAAALASALPHGALTGLPSTAEAERIANSNAKPALATAALLLLATQSSRLPHVVLWLDYATAPRLSAHLSALAALAESLANGALVRNPAALDRLLSVDVFVFDDGMDFDERSVRILKISSRSRAVGGEAVALAAAALSGRGDARALALRLELEKRRLAKPAAHGRRQFAGGVSFLDDKGASVTLFTPAQALREKFAAPSKSFSGLLSILAAKPERDLGLRPLVVVRDRKVLGVIQFARGGPVRIAQAVAALRAQNPDARFVHISAAPQEDAEIRSAEIGFDAVFGGLDRHAKVQTARSLGERIAWIGNGADPDAASVRAASIVSISLAGIENLPRDDADIVLLRKDLSALIAARRAAGAHSGRLKADHRTVRLANFLAVAGGFAAGFGNLQAGLTSNLGTAAVFLARWRMLNGLSARASRFAKARRNAPKLLAAPQSQAIPVGERGASKDQEINSSATTARRS